jgi:nucleoside-diphosphate-sugar epimerase
MYGCNKLYCEHLGRYYARHYKQLAVDTTARVDFRCLRFPGLMSAITVPAGGTSDFAPEMVHAAAQGHPYPCFVRPDTRIPFMAMPDAIDALMRVAAAPRDALTRTAYNLSAFSVTAEDIRRVTLRAFPDASITWRVDEKRQTIVDSWPADVDDTAARQDWGFDPQYDFTKAFENYLIPTIRERYVARAPEPAPADR